MAGERPCRYCVAYHGEVADAEMCEFAHRDEQRVYDLAKKLARMGQGDATDEHVGWFLEDADAIVDDFDPTPEKWTVRKMRAGKEFIMRFSVNGVTYVVEDGEGFITPVRLSTLREQERLAI